MYFALRVPAMLLSALCIGEGWQYNALNGLLPFLLKAIRNEMFREVSTP